MIKIDRKIISGIAGAQHKEDLYRYLQNAIELEHATIPPYLTAMYSLIPGKNVEITKLLRSIVIEEMLHLTIAANILVAIGGSPQINNPKFVPAYPAPLPMGIGSGLIVPIEAFSKCLVMRVFMKIEEPEHPIPVEHRLMAAPEKEYGTIGEFYAAIQRKIAQLGDSIFVVGPDRQVLSWFPAEKLFPIVDVKSANKAIDVIVIEGEGTSTDPFELAGEPAHYYRFGEVYYGKRLIKTCTGYAYGGEPIPFDESGVYPMVDNPTEEMYPPGSHVAMLSHAFTEGYSSLLNALHDSFNGHPASIDAAIGLMYQLRLQAQTLMAAPLPSDARKTAGPVYKYSRVN
jgi:hypothetical protein